MITRLSSKENTKICDPFLCLVFREDYVWLAGEVFDVEAVAEGESGKQSGERGGEHFGLGVFALDAAHVVGAGLFAVDVGHVR